MKFEIVLYTLLLASLASCGGSVSSDGSREEECYDRGIVIASCRPFQVAQGVTIYLDGFDTVENEQIVCVTGASQQVWRTWNRNGRDQQIPDYVGVTYDPLSCSTRPIEDEPLDGTSLYFGLVQESDLTHP